MESHEPDLLDEIHDYEKALKIQDDYTRVEFDTPTRTLLDFAVKLTMDIRAIDESDIESLRACGFSDADILDAVHLTSYFNFINRVLDALGAKPEPDMRFGKETASSYSEIQYSPYSDDEEAFPQGA